MDPVNQNHIAIEIDAFGICGSALMLTVITVPFGSFGYR